MATPETSIGGRIMGAIFVLVLFALVIFFALRAVPKAERPTLHSPAPGITQPHLHK